MRKLFNGLENYFYVVYDSFARWLKRAWNAVRYDINVNNNGQHNGDLKSHFFTGVRRKNQPDWSKQSQKDNRHQNSDFFRPIKINFYIIQS